MATIGITRSTTWNVFTIIGITRSTTWDVLAPVSITRSTTWNLDSCNEPIIDPTGACDPTSACEPCGLFDTDVFKRVSIDYFVQGGARISWELDNHFTDPIPHTFQLQFSHAGVPTGDDWIDVGSPVVNGSFAIDTSKRMFGKTTTTSYRIVLTTSIQSYVSAPAIPFGNLNKRDWLLVREIMRKELLRHEKFNSVPGFLLKARRFGVPCECLDPLTGEIIDTSCPDCGGTGFKGTGYYAPVPSQFVELGLENAEETRDIPMRGTIKDVVIKGRFLGCLPLIAGDAWVANGSDKRYHLHRIQELAHWKGVPMIYGVEMRPAAFTDDIYSVIVPE